MRILDRYITKSIISVFFGCVFLFIFLYVIIDIFGHLDEILKNKTGLLLLQQYYLAYLPIIFVQVAPIACLLATLYTLGSLNRNNEIIAMRASGLSVWQITKTAVIFGIIVSVSVFLLNEKTVARSHLTIKKIKGQIEAKGKTEPEKREIIKNLSMYGLRNRLFFVNQFSARDNTMEGITILEQDKKQNVTKKIVAAKGMWEGGVWTFYNCVSYEYDDKGQITGEPSFFESEIMDITESPRDFLNQIQLPEYMNIPQLKNYIYRLSKSGASSVVKNLRIDLYQKFSDPLTSLVIIVVGIPFALKIRKRATALASFGICLLMGFLYYVVNAMSIAFGKAGFLPPLLAVSLSHAIFFLLGSTFAYTLP